MKKHITLLLMCLCFIGTFAKPPEKGYRGFLEWNTEFSPSEYHFEYQPDCYWLYGMSTSHGYQFNPHLFIGGGLWIQYGDIAPGWLLSEVLFVQARTDWTFGKIPLYADLRFGGTLFGHTIDNNFDTLWISPTVGYRLDFGKKVKFNFGAGVSIHGCDTGAMTNHYVWKPFAALRVGIEF